MKIDPLQRTCICGNFRYFNKLHYIKMILFGSFTYTCNYCGRKHEYKLVYHSVEVHNNTRILNKELMEDKEKVWKNC